MSTNSEVLNIGAGYDVNSQDSEKSKKNEVEGHGQSGSEVLREGCGQSELERLPEELHRIIFKMLKIEDLKAVRLTSSTMRRQVWECEDIRFKHWKLSDPQLKELSRFAEEVTIIEDLTVSLAYDYEKIEDFISSMRPVLERHEEIESLRFIFLRQDCQFISETIRNFGEIIRSLEFRGLKWDPIPNLVKERLPSLEGLVLDGCDLADQEQELEKILQEFGDNLVQLKLVDTSLSGEGVAKIWKPLPKLTKLELETIELNLTSHELSKMLTLMPNIQSLKLSHGPELTGEGVSTFCQPLPKLTSIDLGSYGKLTDTGLNELLSIIPNLEILVLPRVSELSGEGIINACRSLPKVTTLEMLSWDNLTDRGLSEILSLMPTLQNLRLPSGSKLSGEGVKSICKSLPQLTELDISNCESLTDLGLSQIFSLTPNLQSLVLPIQIGRRLSGGGMANIFQSIPQLTTLDLGICGNLTDDGLRDVLSVLPNMKNLKLNADSGLSDQYIDDLQNLGLEITEDYYEDYDDYDDHDDEDDYPDYDDIDDHDFYDHEDYYDYDHYVDAFYDRQGYEEDSDGYDS